jgi:hypothetical protein
MMWTFWWSNLRLRALRVSTVCHCAGVAMFSKSTCIPHRLVHHRSCRAHAKCANLLLSQQYGPACLGVPGCFMVTFFVLLVLLHRRDSDRFGNEVRLAHGSISEISNLFATKYLLRYPGNNTSNEASILYVEIKQIYTTTLLCSSRRNVEHTDDSSVRLHLQILSEAPPYLSCKQTVVIQYP